jgi:regulator of sigma E protease
VKLAPEEFLGLGLKMHMGKIAALQSDSVAVRAGLQVGDRIAKVNGLDVETDLDPFRLTETFSENAGKEVTLTVSREVSGGSPEELTITLVPEDRDPWSEPPLEDSPLSIPSIGAAYHLVPTVFAVHEGSPAAAERIEPRDTIMKLELIAPPGSPKDRLAKDVVIKIGEKNWGFAMWFMQEFGRTREVRLTVKPAAADKPRIVTLHPEPIADWYLPTTRGLELEELLTKRQAEDLTQALSMGAQYTIESAEDIYLMLRGLFMGEISYRAFSGPIGIARLAYSFANEGLLHFIRFLGLISINLAVVNFLPIPVLDGGHMVFLLWEGILRRKPSERVVATATYCGLAFVLCLFVLVCYLDLFPSLKP